MTIAAFSFVGVVVGALLQYFFSRHLDHQRHLRELRTKAYTDYLKCVCEEAHLGETGGEEAAYGLGGRTADAKSRVCLYGSSQVISAFAAFDEAGAATRTAEQCRLFTEMVSLMRQDSGVSDMPELSALQTVLLGPDRNGT